jgi:uncharacterized protein YaeQ
MALKATIFKAELQIADMDRHYYGEHALTIARHPSETDERMMVRLLAFALHAGPALAFGKGLSTEDEPDLWQKDLTGSVQLWLDVGQPDERRLLKACGRADRVAVYSYGSTSTVWWGHLESRVARARNLHVYGFAPAITRDLATLAERSMRLQCTVQDGQAWISGAERTIEVTPVRLMGA